MPFPELRKPSRSQLKTWRSLDRAQARRREGLFLAEGLKVVSELFRSSWKVHALLAMEHKKAFRDLLQTGFADKTEVYSLAEEQWLRLSQDKNPEGIMAVASPSYLPDLSRLPEKGHLVLAWRINNPNNLGALIRTAHWFGFGALLLSRGSADITNPKTVRASMGCLFHLPAMPDLDFSLTVPEIKERCLLIAGHPREGIMPHPSSRRIALLLGSESHGLPDELANQADEKWRIPGGGGAESLSLPQAAAIMMYEASKSKE